ncbi:thiamine pyrophosphate-dependent enzyme [Magnetospira sp. QH-2]|uniref:thiamine pyrophosphate-dependent enzyme n=1 Tax=Magnetospira sp. (strain QH-2) TaxID=1288970 RepID=UPI0003E8192C|nr:thiamine pyrophosphate-dependent enzyme [Magnetospira sp. QH-2]CCQ74954.1 Indolepyruvate oxidoreductase subunit iorA [Magnetospira sp. QH-2]
MNALVQAAAATSHLMSGNEAVARGAWEAGVRVGTAYPGTPSTEILESLALYPDIHAQWSVNEKVSLEVAIGASVAGARAFCAMKHVGMNVASDALMSQTLAGVGGGLVIAIADDVGLSSSQNEQDSRFWGRFAHVPIMEPADSQEAYEMVKRGFEISEQFSTPVILRLTTRICHVKAMVTVGEREERPEVPFTRDPSRWVLVPSTARVRLPWQLDRETQLTAFAEQTDLNVIEDGSDKRIGLLTSGPAYMHAREAFPNVPIMKLGFTCPLPVESIKAFAATVDKLVVVEETEPVMENELKAAGLHVHGKDILPRIHELSVPVIQPAIKKLLGEPVVVPETASKDMEVFPRPPTMCVGCPHLSVYYCLSKLHRNINIAGDIGCYTLGAGHPWNALDTTTCMGASMGMALGMDLGRAEADKSKGIVAVIGDSTFLHMGMQGLLDMVYNRGNVTVMLLDNRTTGMTGGQSHAGTGTDIHGDEAPSVDFAKLAEALGVNPERIRKVNPYEMPTIYKMIKEEVKQPEPSVIITDQPCVLIPEFQKYQPLKVIDEDCTGCANCLNVGCPAILVTKREMTTTPKGKPIEKAWVTIETAACTGCNLCPTTCGPNAIVPADSPFDGIH